jgi:hypothetical protein
MRRLTAAAGMLALLVLSQADCQRQNARPASVEDDAPPMTVVSMGDPRGAAQLIRGFYGNENNSWRWTAKNFAVTLARPSIGARNGARLEMSFNLLEANLQKTGAITISAKLNGAALPPETFSMAGNFTYARDISASELPGKTALAEFNVDKALPPGDGDTRELALVVTAIGLLPK